MASQEPDRSSPEDATLEQAHIEGALAETAPHEEDANSTVPELRHAPLGEEMTTPAHGLDVEGPAGQGVQTQSTVSTIMPTNHERVASKEGGNRISGSTGSRPATAASRTHIPSVTSRAFFAPMSSQRLQAHRGQRPISQVQYRPRNSDDFAEDKSATNRNSTGSVVTTRGPGSTYLQYDVDTMPPMSRDTDYTDWTNAGRTIASNELEPVNRPDRRRASLDPLQQRREAPAPLLLDGQDYERFPNPATPREKSPRSFMSNFKRNSRTSVNGTLVNGHINGHTNGHTRLPSEPTPASKDIENQKQAVQRDLGRNHEHFTGKTVFWFGGRWQNARAQPIVIITGTLIIVPSILFFVFSAPWLWHHVSPAVPIFYAYIFFICISSFVHASVSNPGILPRNIHPQQQPDSAKDPLAILPHNRWVLLNSPLKPHGLFEVPTKYCETCNLWRPPRCHHCRICDNCIETQDHHCVWLNNCIGRRNYRYFFAFVASGTLLGIYLFAASIGHVSAWASQHNTSTSTSIDHNRVAFAMFLYGLLAFAYPSALWGYHAILIFRGQTTHEFLNANRYQQDKHRPFRQKTWWQNFVVVLFRPRPPTYLHFKDRYEEGDQRFGEKRGHRTTPLAKEQQGGDRLEMKQFKQASPAEQSFIGPRSRLAVDVTPR